MKQLTVSSVAICGAFSAALLFSQKAEAASFNFNYTFDGTSISQNAGSDTADGTSLSVGDNFLLTVSAAANDFWKVESDYSDFVPLSYVLTESAFRTASITTTWLLDGVIQETLVETAFQGEVHVGAQSWNLLTGLMFDEVIIDWTFDAIDNLASTVISESSPDIFEPFGDPGAPFFRASEISYNNMAAVPLPAGLSLMLGALGGLGLIARRRKLKPV